MVLGWWWRENNRNVVVMVVEQKKKRNVEGKRRWENEKLFLVKDLRAKNQ